MQSNVMLPMDETVKDRGNHYKFLPQRLLYLLGLFLISCLIFSVFSIYMIKNSSANKVTTTLKPVLQSCIDLEQSSSLRHWIKPRSNLTHVMTDKELFWKASFAPRIKKYPFQRVPKIAFMFLTKGPLPLAPLWERFFKGQEKLYSIYVHSSPSYEPDFPSSSVFYKRKIPSQVAEWGMMSICDAERRLLANALLDISNEWFILVSESCIPLYSFSSIYAYIMRSKHSFIQVYDDPGPVGRGRYHYGMEPEVNITEWRKGSQWFEVSRDLALSIIKDKKYYPKFAEFCRPDCYVDEHYFPTMLSIQSPNLLANRTLTWTDWSRGGPHPATFGGEDITEEFLKRLLEGESCLYNDQPTTVCFLFARKFAPSALEPLLLLTPKYLSF